MKECRFFIREPLCSQKYLPGVTRKKETYNLLPEVATTCYLLYEAPGSKFFR